MQLSIYSFFDDSQSWYIKYLVGTSGLEPPTSRLSGVCSNQLSYVPVIYMFLLTVYGFRPNLTTISCLVEVSGIEPLTPCLQGRCSPSWAIPPKKSGLTWLRKQMPRLTEHNLLKTNRGNRRSITFLFLPRLGLAIDCEKCLIAVLPKRRWSSRTFRYGYLVTTSPQSPVLP